LGGDHLVLSYTVPQPDIITVAAVDPRDLGGEDISLLGGTLNVSPAGDWITVRGVDAARQSVFREFPANPGSFVRRENWGVGLSGKLFKGATQSMKGDAISRAKTRLRANPRITKVREVSGSLPETGLQMTIRVDAVGGPIDITDQVFK
jgi:hypothetical protein